MNDNTYPDVREIFAEKIKARNDQLAKDLKERYTDEERNKIVEDNYRGAD